MDGLSYSFCYVMAAALSTLETIVYIWARSGLGKAICGYTSFLPKQWTRRGLLHAVLKTELY